MINVTDQPSPLEGLILASGSPRRRDLLMEAGLEFQVISPEVDELPPGAMPPRELCLANAHLKALAVLIEFPESIILASDTVVALNGKVFGKPTNLEEAARNLAKFRGRVHEVMTGVVLRRGEESVEFVETSFVKFKNYPDAVIAEYLAQVPVLDKAGGYAIQDHGDWLVEKIEGDYHNIVGLPVSKVLAYLSQMGFPSPDANE